jgi:hypothetical protein
MKRSGVGVVLGLLLGLGVLPGLVQAKGLVEVLAVNLYVASLDWAGIVQPPTSYPVAEDNPALSAARVIVEVTGAVQPPDAFIGEALPVSFEALYR